MHKHMSDTLFNRFYARWIMMQHNGSLYFCVNHDKLTIDSIHKTVRKHALRIGMPYYKNNT